MGLCKCPKKKVTTLFCFEHRVNVCEYCLVSNHAKCIVQSYLQWLQDSDYNPKCDLCQKLLADEDCVRLLCYHIFHWQCLNRFAKQLPNHTAPAGYSCPDCQKPIFPAGNVVSPVADVLRKSLMQVNWARAGLGLPLIEENHPKDLPVVMAVINQKPTENEEWRQMKNIHNVIEVEDAASSTSAHYAPRKLFDSTHGENSLHTSVDHDDDKYKRRSALDWFSRWFRSRSMQTQKDPNAAFKRFVILIIFGLIGLFTLIAIFTQVGRAVANKDPSLDLLNNPNIRVGRLINPQ